MTYLVAYRKATTHATSKGDIVMKTGDGTTWSALSTIYSDATYDARDPGITKLSDGSLICSFLLGVAATQAPIVQGVNVIKSVDNGATWGAPINIGDGFTNHSACCSPVIELGDGTLLLAFYGKNTGETNRSVHLMKSTDAGETWASEVTIANGHVDGKDYSEPNLLLLSGGNILCLIRTGAATIFKTVSTDSGDTWAAAALTFAGTGAPHVIQITGGDLVCCYRSAAAGAKTAVRTSADSGANWSAEFIYDATSYVSMMYSTPIENTGGDIAIAYAFEISGESHVSFKTLTTAELP